MKKTKILICVGSGGVGKTTIAAALGVRAAQQGQTVLVLTIDPSKRLANTLGIENTSEVSRVPGQNFSGELYASIIEHKKVFDDFVRRASGQDVAAEKILNNKLYQQLSTNLSGSQEFTALEKLYSCYESGKYDLIILDTPPAKHAMDFLSAPQKLAALFNEGVAKWFRDPHGKKANIFHNILHVGTKQVLRALEMMTGSDFIHELADFFIHIEKWQDKLEKRNIEVHRMLVGEQTEFCLVTSFDLAKLKEAESFARDIKRGGYHLSTIILNRAVPDWLNPALDQSSSLHSEELKRLYKQLKEYYSNREIIYAQFAKKIEQGVLVLKLPEFIEQIYDVHGLQMVVNALNKGETK